MVKEALDDHRYREECDGPFVVKRKAFEDDFLGETVPVRRTRETLYTTSSVGGS